MSRYREISDIAFSVFNDFTPYVEPVSIDEAFLDVTGSVHLYGSARNLAEALRKSVHERCGVTCSVGVATNRLLAKLGSEENKPNGLTVMPTDPDEISAFLAGKPVGAIWGVGTKTAELLRPYGILTCGDLQRIDIAQLSTILGSADAAVNLRNHAFGISSSDVLHTPAPEKSVSREHTFDNDESDREKVRALLLELVTDVGQRFRSEKRWARTAKLKLRNSNFETITRQIHFDSPARDDISFRSKALELFNRETVGAVRLIGFGLCDITTSRGEEPSLFADPGEEKREKHERLSETLDGLRKRGLI